MPLQQRPSGESARFLFYLSIIVLHETTHLVEKGRYHDHIDDHSTKAKRALFYCRPEDRIPEFGWDLEKAVFFGVRYNCSPWHNVIPEIGIWRSTFEDQYLRGRTLSMKIPKQMSAVPVSHIHRYFTTQFWEDVKKYGYQNMETPACTLTADRPNGRGRHCINIRGSKLWDFEICSCKDEDCYDVGKCASKKRAHEEEGYHARKRRKGTKGRKIK